MTGLGALIWRNTKLCFKDKGMFFTSLITPLILLVLYANYTQNGDTLTADIVIDAGQQQITVP